MPVSTREERRQLRKVERQEAQRKQAQRNQVRRRALLGGGLAVIVVAAALLAFFVIRGRAVNSAPLPGQHFDDPVTASGGLYQHIADGQPIQYDHHPPNHGNHYGTPMPWGVYDSPVQEGRFVHNMEHGGIVVLYNCPTGCADTVNQLKGLMNGLPRDKFGEVKLVVSPYSQSDHLITLSAWDYEQDLDAYDFNTVKAFYDAHVDKGPEQIP